MTTLIWSRRLPTGMSRVAFNLATVVSRCPVTVVISRRMRSPVVERYLAERCSSSTTIIT